MDDESTKHTTIDRLGGESRLSKLEKRVQELEELTGVVIANTEAQLTRLVIGPGTKVLSHPLASEAPATWVDRRGRPPPMLRDDIRESIANRAGHEFLTLVEIGGNGDHGTWAVAERWSYEDGREFYFMAPDIGDVDVIVVLQHWYLPPYWKIDLREDVL